MTNDDGIRRAGSFRWVICALLFFGTTVNYVDRLVLGILATDLQRSLGWNDVVYGYINVAFQAAYALGLLLAGGLIDRFGARKGLSVAVVVWSLASMAHGLASSALGFGAARLVLGLSEAGNFPAAIKTVAEWFPRKERALATGIFNAGSNLGAVVAPLLVPWIALHYGWRWAFVLTGLLGFVWLAGWLALYRQPEEHPRLTRAELDYIRSDAAEPVTKIPWARLISRRETWAFALGKFLTDPIWWFYLTWLPKFLHKAYGLDLSKLGPPLVCIYVAADLGSIGGGWLSSALIKRGRSVNAARKTTMLICALCVTPIFLAVHAANLWTAVALVGLAAAAHQGWSANLFTVVSDTFPRRAVGSVVGIGGMVGSLGGMLFTALSGHVLVWTGSYMALFVAASCAYLVALAVLHILMPKIAPVDV